MAMIEDDRILSKRNVFNESAKVNTALLDSGAQDNTEQDTLLPSSIDYFSTLMSLPKSLTIGNKPISAKNLKRLLAAYKDKLFNDDYILLDYIESTGTQYIDTKLVASEGYDAYMDMEILDFGPSTTSVYGVIGSHNPTEPWGRNSVDARGPLFVGSVDTYAWFNDTQSTDRHNYWFSTVGQDVHMSVDNVEKTPYDKVNDGLGGDHNSTNTLYVFFANNYPSFVPSKLRLYSCKIYAKNGDKRDFVPAMRKNDNEVGLYDKIHNVFYTNIGTGKFKSNVATITPVEYIQMNGTQYIQTTYCPNTNAFEFWFDIQMDNTSGTYAIFGTRDPYGSASGYTNQFDLWRISGNSFRIGHGSKTSSYTYQSYTSRTKYLYNSASLQSTNNEVWVTFGTSGKPNFVATRPLVIGGNYKREYSGSSNMIIDNRFFRGKIYGFQAYEGVLLHDWIPAVSDGEAGLYDQVDGIFYGNSGTGTIVAGPEIQ